MNFKKGEKVKLKNWDKIILTLEENNGFHCHADTGLHIDVIDYMDAHKESFIVYHVSEEDVWVEIDGLKFCFHPHWIERVS